MDQGVRLPRGRPKGSKNKKNIVSLDSLHIPKTYVLEHPNISKIKEKKPCTETPVSSKPLDICAIIRLCSKLNVSHLKTRDFFVSFHGPNAPGIGQMSKAHGVKSSAPVVELPPEVAALKEDFDRSQLMIDDPVAFEQQQIDMDIERGQQFETKDYRRP